MSKSTGPNAADTDGYLRSQSTTNFATARDATDATGADAPGLFSTQAVFVNKGSNRAGDDEWQIYRSYMAFDTSQVSASFNVYVATLKLTNLSGSVANGDIIIVKSNKPDLSTDIATADWDDIPGISAGNTMDGNVTDYSSVIASGSYPTTTGGTVSISLNAAAVADIKSGDVLKLAIINYNYDYKNIDFGTTSEANGMYFTDHTTPSYRPLLTLRWGFGHKVLGVSHGNIAKIAGIQDEKVKKVFSKDSS